MKPFPIWCEKCAKQDVCHIGDIVPKCYEPKTEPQTEVKVEPTWVGVTYGRFEDEPQTERSSDA